MSKMIGSPRAIVHAAVGDNGRTMPICRTCATARMAVI